MKKERDQDGFTQRPVRELTGEVWDAAIVGAGPAGSVCAWRLAQGGARVLLIDKERFPRHKVCGDLLIADTIAMLHRVGLYERIKDIAYESRAIEVSSPSGHRFDVPGEFFALIRKRFDFELAQHAVRAGAVVAHGNVVEVEHGESGDLGALGMSDCVEPVRARTIILATGGVVDLLLKCGLVRSREPSALAMRCYVRSTVTREKSIIAYDESILPGYGWVIPLGRGNEGRIIYNVGCGSSYRHISERGHNLKKTLRAFMREFDPAREVMEEGEIISPMAGAAIRYGLEDAERAVDGRIIGIGESIGATYPFTGEGIGKAMETGLAAAESILRGLKGESEAVLVSYRQRLRELQPRYHSYTRAERWLSNRYVNDFIARRVTRSRYLQEKLQAFMSETDDPTSLFSLRSLVISYFK